MSEQQPGSLAGAAEPDDMDGAAAVKGRVALKANESLERIVKKYAKAS